MARNGRAGPALGISAIGSFIGGTVSIIGLMFVAVPLAKAALRFGPPEYFSLMCAGLVLLTYLTQGSIVKSLMMALVGILLGCVGLDMVVGSARFTFDINELTDGVGVIPVVMGLFGVTEVFSNLETVIQRDILQTKIKNIWPSLKDYALSKWAIARGSILGFLFGILPGGGAVISSFLSYAIEKKLSKTPERFGKGAI
jgi:putative tricarboxylic transport membrane protein